MPATEPPRAGAQPDRDRDRLLVVEQQRRQRGAGAEPVAADGAAGGVHRVAEVAQPLDVVAHGPRGDLEPFGQFGAGPLAGRLQQRQQFAAAAPRSPTCSPICHTIRNEVFLMA